MVSVVHLLLALGPPIRIDIFLFFIQVSSVANVYEEVDEREYSKRRQERLEDDWIVDDGRLLIKIFWLWLNNKN